MKKTLSIIMALCILLSFCSFGESAEVVNGTYKTGTLIAAEPITLRVAVTRHQGDQTTSYDVKPFVKRSVEETGINFEWIELTTEANTQFSTMLASGDDMPDIILADLGDLYTKNMSLFADLSDMLDEWAPHVVECYEEWGIDMDIITESDGSIRRLLTGMNKGNAQSMIDNMPWIDTTWLDRLGLEMPTTTEELYDVLVAFKENDADGDGDPDNEIPLDFCDGAWQKQLRGFGYIWGVYGADNYYVVKDGVVEPIVNTDAYREFIEYFHMLYEEGLINPEGFTQNGDQANASLKAQKVGVWFDWSPQMQRGISESADKCVFLGKITAPGYEDAALYPAKNPLGYTRDFQITSTCQHKEAALRWWDYLSSTDELRWLTGRGPEGICWEFMDDGVTHIPSNPTDEEKQALLEKYGLTEDYDVSMVGASFYMDSHFPLIEENTSYAPPAEGEAMSQGWTRMNGANVIIESGMLSDYMPKTIVPDEAKTEFTFATEGLTSFIDKSFSEFIINGVTDESWAEYLSELEEYNYEYYIEYFQKFYDNAF